MEKQYAVFVESSYHVEGDERSRTAPGHGYPAHDVKYTEVIKFKDEAELRKWIEDQDRYTYNKKKYEVVTYTPVTVTKTVEFRIE